MADTSARDDLVYRAKLAEQAERYNDMVDHMEKIVKMGTDLTVEERNLLSVAFKNVIGAQRASWRIISSIEAKNESSSDDAAKMRYEVAKKYRGTIEASLRETCGQIIGYLDDHLLKKETDIESQVFYLKMKGDYYRYLAEFQIHDEEKKPQEHSLAAYKLAEEASKSLPTTHPIRLGLALNFSVFWYEILKDKSEACDLAKTAFDEAISDLDTLGEDSYKDSTLILQLLRDNLTLWTSDQGQQEDEKEDAQVEQEAN